MKLTHLILIGSLFLGACTQEYEESLQMPETSAGVSKNVSIIEYYLSKTHKGLTRGENYTLIPYIVEGDTVMYIANYGEGWEVFSNDTRVPMVLMKSETGSFYPNVIDRSTPFDELFHDTAAYLNELKKTQETPTDTINGEWGMFGVNILNGSGSGKNEETNSQYYWKYIGSSLPQDNHYESTPTGGRLKTKWDQESNYNLFTPLENGEHTPLGCVAVAIGQYLFFTHYKDNHPAQTVTNAYYDAPSNSYSFSGLSSTVWNSFNSFPDYYYNQEYMKPTAIFLSWVGKNIGTTYSLSGSDAGLTSNTTLSFFNNQTQLNATVMEYSLFHACELLKKGYPVLLRAETSSGEGAHAWIIDYYESNFTSYKSYYIYVKKTEGPNPDEEEENDLIFLENTTIEEIQSIYGDVEVDTRLYTSGKSFFMCNWGWRGSYDNVKYDPYVLSWHADSYTFNKLFCMYYFI